MTKLAVKRILLKSGLSYSGFDVGLKKEKKQKGKRRSYENQTYCFVWAKNKENDNLNLVIKLNNYFHFTEIVCKLILPNFNCASESWKLKT